MSTTSSIHAYVTIGEDDDRWWHAECQQNGSGKPMSFGVEPRKLAQCLLHVRCAECGLKIVPPTVFFVVTHLEEDKPVMIIPCNPYTIPGSYPNWTGYLENLWRRLYLTLPWDQKLLECNVIEDPLKE